MGKEIGVTFGAICNYERGRRVPPFEKREFIAKVTRGAVPVWCWGWDVFVFDDPNTWPADDPNAFLNLVNSKESRDFFGITFHDKWTARKWKEWGITHYRRKGDDNAND